MSAKPVAVVHRTGGFGVPGVTHPLHAIAKLKLAGRIAEIVGDAGLSAKASAAALGIHPAALRDLSRGEVSGFSYEQLLSMLAGLGCDVVVQVSAPRPDEPRVLGVRFCADATTPLSRAIRR